MKYKLICAAALLLLSADVWAQDSIATTEIKENKLTIDINSLTRGEVRKGGLSVNTDEEQEDFAAFIIERTLLNIGYERQGLTTQFSFQHSGTWGGKDAGNLSIYEAWVQLKSKQGLFAKVGRQPLAYDDQRIFGNDHWSMTGISHDLLKVGYEGHGHKLHLMGAFNQNPANMNGGTYYTGGLQPYKAMEALWYHYDIPHTNLGGSLLFMNVGMQNDGDNGGEQKTYQQQIVGTYWAYRPKGLTAEAAFYYQMGRSEKNIPIGAWMGSLKATAVVNDKWTAYAGYDYMSGDENFATPDEGQIGMSQHTKICGFSSIYGSHHKFYGAMDFFYVSTYVGGFTPGLQNLYAGGKWKPSDKFSIDGSFHYLATATKLQNADKPLGYEIEVAASYSIYKDVKLSAGYSFMRGTDTMKVLKRATDDRYLQWGWLMLSVTPRIFSTKW